MEWKTKEKTTRYVRYVRTFSQLLIGRKIFSHTQQHYFHLAHLKNYNFPFFVYFLVVVCCYYMYHSTIIIMGMESKEWINDLPVILCHTHPHPGRIYVIHIRYTFHHSFNIPNSNIEVRYRTFRLHLYNQGGLIAVITFKLIIFCHYAFFHCNSFP